MIEKVAPTVPVSTWSKSNSTEVITVDKKLGELNRLSKVFRTVFYEYYDGQGQLKNYVSQQSTVDVKV